MRDLSNTFVDVARESVHVLRHGRPDTSAGTRLEMQESASLSEPARTLPHEAFEAKLKPLTARQLSAINLIMMGKTIVATAKFIKVDPATIHRWKAGHPLFAAELNRRQAALFEGMAIKLRLTMDKAVNELHALMTGPSKRERIETMWKLLPMLKPQRLITPSDNVEPTDIVDERIRAGRAERGEVVEGEITLEERLEHVPAEFVERSDHSEPASDRVARFCTQGRAPAAVDAPARPCIQDRTTRNEDAPCHPEERSDEGPRLNSDGVGCVTCETSTPGSLGDRGIADGENETGQDVLREEMIVASPSRSVAKPVSFHPTRDPSVAKAPTG